MSVISDRFEEIFKDKTPLKIIFSNRRKKSQELKKICIRPFSVKKRTEYQAEFFYEKKVTHENIEPDVLSMRCGEYATEYFKQVNLFFSGEEIQILCSKAEKPKVSRKSNAGCCNAVSNTHDRRKNYIIPDNEPCDFLAELGVMSPEGKVYNHHYSKFRQINRFLEIVDDTYRYLEKKEKNDRPLRVIDFGCGKAYLTFALYHYFHSIKKRDIEVIGLDLKADVMEFCNRTAARLGFEKLTFLVGDIADYTSDRADMVVTLHACDTATDYALSNAVRWGAKVILSVPCCQHELFKQIKNDEMRPMLKHGIIKDKFTELLTDGLRGLSLEKNGYNVSMIEFTSMEHTSKNIMIRAVKAGKMNPEKCKKAKNEYEMLKAMFNVTPSTDEIRG